MIERDIPEIGSAEREALKEAAQKSNGVLAEMKQEGKNMQWEHVKVAKQQASASKRRTLIGWAALVLPVLVSIGIFAARNRGDRSVDSSPDLLKTPLNVAFDALIEDPPPDRTRPSFPARGGGTVGLRNQASNPVETPRPMSGV